MEGDRADSPDDDLVEAAEGVLPHILMFYKRFEGKRPVMLLDLQGRKIYAYPYEEFKADLGHCRQLEYETWRRRSWWRRLRSWFFYRFRRFL